MARTIGILATAMLVASCGSTGGTAGADGGATAADTGAATDIGAAADTGAADAASGACVADPNNADNKCCRSAANDKECVGGLKAANAYAWTCSKNTAVFALNDHSGSTCDSTSSMTFNGWCCAASK